jgi:2-polyprenyl-3-methyl-5-hydroxy-6-metoxy-1,4-benzoquinol methylase
MFEGGADIDVEALMARIREAAQTRRRSTPRSANPVADGHPKTIEVGNLLQEIDRSGPFADAINQIPLKSSGWKRRLESRVKRFLKYLVHWNTKAQADFNRSAMRSLGLVAQDLQNIQRNLSLIEKQMRESEQSASTKMDEQIGIVVATLEELNRNADALAANLSAVEQKIKLHSSDSEQNLAQLRDEMGRSAQQTIQEVAEQISRINHEFDGMSMRVLRAERSARKVSEAGDARPATAKSDGTSGETLTRNPNHQMNAQGTHVVSEAQNAGKLGGQPFDYFMFEHKFRGSVAEIKRRQSAYLELFRGRENVLDLGCGRGEFVELLSENEINVKGVDNNEDMVEFCSDRGLRIVLADVLDYLSGLPDKALDGIAAFQVVEHLSFDQIRSLIKLCEQKLMPGGIIVAETINTYCPVALAEFYIDPTHVRPVPAQMLWFLFEQGAFRVQALMFSSAIGGHGTEVLEVPRLEIPQEASSYRDYAVVAIKL